MAKEYIGGSREFPLRVPGWTVSSLIAEKRVWGDFTSFQNGKFVKSVEVRGGQLTRLRSESLPDVELVNPDEPMVATLGVRYSEGGPLEAELPWYFAPKEFKRRLFKTQIKGAVWDDGLQKYLAYGEPGKGLVLAYLGEGNPVQVEVQLGPQFQVKTLADDLIDVTVPQNLILNPHLTIVVEEIENGWSRKVPVEVAFVPGAAPASSVETKTEEIVNLLYDAIDKLTR